MTRCRLWGVLSAALLSASVFPGCHQQETGAVGESVPPPVTVMKVEPKDVALSLEYLGQTKDSGRVEIRSRLQGYLLSKHFDDGQRVKEGDLLYLIDPREFEAAVAESEARVTQVEAQLLLAQTDLARAKQLFAQNAVAQRDVDLATAGEATKRADLRLAKAQLDTAQLELSYTTITAPLTGKIGKNARDPGSYLDAGSNSYLNEIIAVDPITVAFTISEREGIDLRNDVSTSRVLPPEKNGLIVTADLIDGTRIPGEGRISYLDIKVDPQTGTFQLEAKLPNPEENLTPGQFVKVHVRGFTRPNAVVVPQAAVVQSPTGPFVYTVGDDGKAAVQPVALGPWSDGGWIAEKGLSAGDAVVVGGLSRVRPSGPVKVEKTVGLEAAIAMSKSEQGGQGAEESGADTSTTPSAAQSPSKD